VLLVVVAGVALAALLWDALTSTRAAGRGLALPALPGGLGLAAEQGEGAGLAARARRRGGAGTGEPVAAASSRAARGGASPWGATASWAMVRHVPLLLALLGLPAFLLAVADPRRALVREETSYPGRRISLMIDASSSMLSALPSTRLASGAPNDAAFFTTVGAARHFVELRRRGPYRDLMSLIEFGDDAYVITPFTSDYDNILLSIALIGDWNEFMAFPDQGTTIARAIDHSVGLFRVFDFLDAAGNLMVIFTDGSDAEVMADGRSVFDVLREAERAEIPVYFIRTGAGPRAQASAPRAAQGTVQAAAQAARGAPAASGVSAAPGMSGMSGMSGVSDAAWQAAVARTGGRFYAASDERTILQAIQEIDRASEGRIAIRRYSTSLPAFSPFALAAVALWTVALALRFTVPWFQKFP
jgi:Ca-activated chloride channel family protein